MIITTPRPKKRAKATKAQPAKIIGSSVVMAKHPRRRRYAPADDLPPDPEADARVAAFFARVIKPR